MPTAEALSESTWPEGHTVTIDGVEYGAKDIVPGSDKTFDDPWWAIVGPGGMTNWQVFGPLGAGGGLPFGVWPYTHWRRWQAARRTPAGA